MNPASLGTAPPLNPLLTAVRDYPFVKLEAQARALIPPGVTRINFSIGDPRERTPEFIRDAVRAAIPEVSSYPTVPGLPELRRAYAGWARRRFGVTLDPETHLLPANGTKEAVFLMPFAVLGPGAPRDVVVIPTPAYPVYEPSVRLAGGVPYLTPLESRTGWRFDPARVPDAVWSKTAMLWLNTPHNPTGSVLDRAALDRIAALARRHGFWVIADEAYVDVWFDHAPPSLLQSGLEHVGVLHTLSKRSAMTGYRSGFIAGDPRLIEALRRLRPNVGVATPEFVQRGAIAAWNDDAHAEAQRRIYAGKRALLLATFARRGWRIEGSEATFYLWTAAPGGDDVAFVERLMKLGIVALPGSYMGEAGRGFVRVALVPTVEQCAEACARIDAAGRELDG
jgi:LL-diaminopimelate aminotransferase